MTSNTKSTKSAKPKRSISPLTKTYLIGYNLLQTIGWTYLLYQLVAFHLGLYPAGKLYEIVKWTVIIFQNAAVLEVVHAATGIVPSNPVITAFQVASRVMVVCGVLMPTQAARDTMGLPLALFAWSVTEVIRYGNYTLALVDLVPYFVKFLRYTTFIALYPIGVTGELLCIYSAQQEVNRTKLWTISMPNSANFIFNYSHFLVFVMLLYIPLFPQMYLHMFSQRRKVLGGATEQKKK